MKIIAVAGILALLSSTTTNQQVYGFATPIVVASSSVTTSASRLHVASVQPPTTDSASATAENNGSLNRVGGNDSDDVMKGGNHAMRVQMETMLREAQISITKAIEDIDGVGKFHEDSWVRDTGGGGHSRVLAGGKVWEKAGVNLSVVHGTMPVEALKAATERGVNRGSGEQVPFFACGLSCVMHPRNPHCPTMHFNYRYFETDNGEHWWFGTYNVSFFLTGRW
jgi:Coproporphyrinogen III oxidase